MTRSCATAMAILAFLVEDGMAQRLRWTRNTTLNVVLVTFPDDLPQGHTRSDDGDDSTYDLVPGSTAYKISDFERLLGVDEADDFGSFANPTGVRVGTDEDLPETYGSLKKYFDDISGGDYNLTVRILNPPHPDSDHDEYPRWMEMALNKSHYRAIPIRNTPPPYTRREFFIDATAILHSGTIDLSSFSDVPSNDSGRSLTTANKIVFIHSGTSISDGSVLHPQVDAFRGYRYVIGERMGLASDRERADDAIRFGGLSLHAHEIGHLLGFRHPGGFSTVENVYRMQTPGDTYRDGDGNRQTYERWGGADMAGWGLMQGDENGPALESSLPRDTDYAYVASHRSCPQYYNGIFMRDLDWGTHTPITTTTQSQRVDPAPDDFYHIEYQHTVIHGVQRPRWIVLDFRTAVDWGQYVSWYRFAQPAGLLVWRGDFWSAQLLPADGRPLSNALGVHAGYSSREFSTTDIYPWMERLSDPFGAIEGNGLRQTILSMKAYKEDGETLTDDPLVLTGGTHRWTPDWATDDNLLTLINQTDVDSDLITETSDTHIALRNIHVVRGGASGYALVNVYLNYQEGPLPDDAVEWSGSVYVGADVTIGEDQTLDIADDAVVHFLAPRSAGPTSEHPHGVDPNGTNITELIVQDSGTLNIGRNVTFRSMREEYTDSDGDRVDQEDVDPEDHGLTVESGGEVTIQGLTITDGDHYLYSEGEVTLAGDLRISGRNSSLNLRRKPSTAAGTDEAVTIKIASGDATMGGENTSKVEIIVAGAKWDDKTLVEAAELNAVNDTFEPADDNTSGWQGIGHLRRLL